MEVVGKVVICPDCGLALRHTREAPGSRMIAVIGSSAASVSISTILYGAA
jgi:hypothetical protein